MTIKSKLFGLLPAAMQRRMFMTTIAGKLGLTPEQAKHILSRVGLGAGAGMLGERLFADPYEERRPLTSGALFGLLGGLVGHATMPVRRTLMQRLIPTGLPLAMGAGGLGLGWKALGKARAAQGAAEAVKHDTVDSIYQAVKRPSSGGAGGGEAAARRADTLYNKAIGMKGRGFEPAETAAKTLAKRAPGARAASSAAPKATSTKMHPGQQAINDLLERLRQNPRFNKFTQR